MKNPFGKTRDVDHPYAIYVSPLLGDWEWRVLKTYQLPDKEKTNQYARWYCAVRSPMTYGSWEYGDTYVSEIMKDVACELKTGEKEWVAAYNHFTF